MRDEKKITLSHGSGGLLSHRLVKDRILSVLQNPALSCLDDASLVMPVPGGDLIMSTDSFVVDPLFFSGGDIGKLAVCGSVNDIVVSGGRPICLSLGLIIGEGFPFQDLDRIILSIREAADESGIFIATGDTKVVAADACGGIFINTSAVGISSEKLSMASDRISVGDAVLVTGAIAEHGFAILSERNELTVGHGCRSDCASLLEILDVAEKYGNEIKFMRDPTRGGLAAVLNEIVDEQEFGICLEESDIPISPPVKTLAEILGIDPMNIASEGRALIVCSEKAAENLLSDLSRTSIAADSAVIGKIVDSPEGKVCMKTGAGSKRIVDMPAGEIVPRIC